MGCHVKPLGYPVSPAGAGAAKRTLRPWSPPASVDPSHESGLTFLPGLRRRPRLLSAYDDRPGRGTPTSRAAESPRNYAPDQPLTVDTR